MRYLVHSDALYMQGRSDIVEQLYYENVNVKYGYGIVNKIETLLAIQPRGFKKIADLEDDDARTLDELIEAYPLEPIVV
jgi:hypothetical protein